MSSIATNRLAGSIRPSMIRAVASRARPTSLSLGLGQPDLPLAPWAIEALQSVESTPYTANAGRADLVAAVAGRYDGDGVIVTVGTQEAMALALLGLIEPGADVLVPDPGFPAYASLIRAAGARPVPYTLGARFGLDPHAIDQAWTESTQAIVLCSPSNPTAGVASADAVAEIVRMCEERGAFWVSDEIYEDYVWEGQHHSPRAISTYGVVISGLSKSHSAMGLRIGWLAGPRDTIASLVGLHQHLVACAAYPSQVAALAMLEHHDEQVAAIRRVFAGRREVTRDRLMAWGIDEPVLDGAFYAFPDVRQFLRPGESTYDLALQILDETDVVTIPGIAFGDAGEGHLRLAYTVEETILTEALDRVGKFLQDRSAR